MAAAMRAVAVRALMLVYTGEAGLVPVGREPIADSRCIRAVERSALARLLTLLAAGVLALPAGALGKQGAIFSPQLLSLQPGSRTKLVLYVLPVYRGEQCLASAPCSPPVADRVLVPAPRIGSTPVVIFRLIGNRKMVRFVGSPLDRHLRSVVWVRLPRANAPERWAISARADRHVYPDLIDSPLSVLPHQGATNVSAVLRPAAVSGSRPPSWALVVGIVLLLGGVVAVVRTKRRGWRPARRG